MTADFAEYQRLKSAIFDAELKLASAPANARSALAAFVQNAQKDLQTYEDRIEKETAQVRSQQLEAERAAENETKLSRDEKGVFANFLSKDFFTKKDYASLEHFYAHSWDKLSESGKDKMTDRICEGIKRGEIKEEELPKDVLMREADRIHRRMVDTRIRPIEVEPSSAGQTKVPESVIAEARQNLESVNLDSLKSVDNLQNVSTPTVGSSNSPTGKGR